MFDQAIDAAAARAAAKAGPQLIEIGRFARGQDFNVTILGVAHPAVQSKFAGLALHKPAEANTLHASLNQKMENQSRPRWIKQREEQCMLKCTLC